jgi:hypothetical protein
MVAIGHARGLEPRTRRRGLAPGLVLLVALAICAAAASLMISGLLNLFFGHLPAWATFAIYALEVVPAVFFAGATLVSGAQPPAAIPPWDSLP